METLRIAVFLIGIVFTGIAGQAMAGASHCSEDEQVIFNCRAGKNTVSVCASKPIARESGYLQYRFGRIGKPKLIYPLQKSLPNPSIQADMLTYAGGGGAYIRFIKDDYSYVVYSAIGRGWGERAGVAVEKNRNVITDLRCKKPVVSELGPDFFARAGLDKDLRGFELP